VYELSVVGAVTLDGAGGGVGAGGGL